jgi:hypothetical protein
MNDHAPAGPPVHQAYRGRVLVSRNEGKNPEQGSHRNERVAVTHHTAKKHAVNVDAKLNTQL